MPVGAFAARPGSRWFTAAGMLTVALLKPLAPPIPYLCLPQVAAVRVTGPRYWHQLLERRGARRGRGPSLAALYSTRTLFVQVRGGMLAVLACRASQAKCIAQMQALLGMHSCSCF